MGTELSTLRQFSGPRPAGETAAGRDPVGRDPVGRRDIVLAVAGVVSVALLTAAGAQVRVPIPGTPVPMTLQTLVVLLAGVALGPRLGLTSQVLYLSMGLIGLPVFARGGAGPQYMFGATAGYLVGFLVAPYVVGSLTARARSFGAMLKAACVGTAIIFGSGVAWLTVLTADPWLALQLGLLPFGVGAVLKVVLTAAIGQKVGALRSELH